MSHRGARQVTHMIESCHTYECVQTGANRGEHGWHTVYWVMEFLKSQLATKFAIWNNYTVDFWENSSCAFSEKNSYDKDIMSHVTRMNASCHNCTNESRHTCDRVMLHIWMRPNRWEESGTRWHTAEWMTHYRMGHYRVHETLQNESMTH